MFLVDLERCRVVDHENSRDLGDEMDEVDRL